MEKEKKISISILAGIAMLVVVVAGLVIILTSSNRIVHLKRQNSELNQSIQVRDSLVNEMTGTFDEIENNLTFVRNRRGQLTMASQEGTVNKKEALIADIKLMDQMLTESSVKIDELEKKLKDSGIEIKSFRNKIAQLNKSITEQDNSIKQLTAELEARDYTITEMDKSIVVLKNDIASKTDTIIQKSQIIANKEEIIVNKDNEMNKAYFVSGTSRELKEKGIIDKEGGFLGLGKSSDVKENINEQNFTELDKRTTLTLPINAKKAEVISEHPDNSYQLVYDNDQVAYLQIEDPAEFWKITKFLVVEKR